MMSSMRPLALTWLCCAGCVDIFALPLAERDGGTLEDSGADRPDLPDPGDGGDGFGDGDPTNLPPACAKLACTPASNEGDVTLSDGEIAGCHAYHRLSIGGTSLKVVRHASGIGFTACADTITITGLLSATEEGDLLGPGAGKACGSGGSHAGAGADPGGCGLGLTYGDPLQPRALGSGGGGQNAGTGGGAIELSAGQINLVAALISADGEAGIGVSAGGGSGGSILLRATTFAGVAQLSARGGIGIGLAGGGGGGGRIAVWGNTSAANLSLSAKGGQTMVGGADGANGTTVEMP